MGVARLAMSVAALGAAMSPAAQDAAPPDQHTREDISDWLTPSGAHTPLPNVSDTGGGRGAGGGPGDPSG